MRIFSYHPSFILWMRCLFIGELHILFFLILIAPVFGWIFSRWHKNTEVSFRDWNLFFLVVFIAHPLLDSCTVYGTGIFEPFSDYRLQFTALFIVEPLYTLPLLIACFALLILKMDSFKRKFWSKFGLGLSTFFLIFAIGNKLYVENIFSDSMEKQNIRITDYTTSPTPLNNILWNIVAKDTSGFWVGYYSHFDSAKDVQFSFIPRNDSIAGDIRSNYVVQNLIRFSNGYYCFTMENGELHYNDLRFSFAGEFTPDARDFVFSYTLKKDDSQPYGIDISRNAWRMSRFSGFSKLIERIKGI